MLALDDLKKLVRTEESEMLERKKSCPNGAELRQTLVAFANSVPSGQFGVILVGIGPDRSLHSVQSPDSVQQTILKVASNDCFPPVRCSLQLFEHEGHDLLAVIIPHSSERPHFTGKSYLRIGSVSKEASDVQFEALINSRHDKIERIAQYLDRTVDVRFHEGTWIWDSHPTAGSPSDGRFRIKACDRWLVMLTDPHLEWTIGVPTDIIRIEWSAEFQGIRLYVGPS